MTVANDTPPAHADDWRSLPTRLLRHAWVGAWLASVLIAFGVTRLMPAYQPVSDHFGPLAWARAAPGQVPLATDAWQARAPFDGSPGAAWVKVDFHLTEGEARRGAAALVLSGPFSARVIVNGVHVGDKGRPGFSRTEEIPGPIDASIPLGGAVHPGANQLLMLISVQSAGHRPGAILQTLSIAPFGAGPQRPLSRYAIALSQAGLLLATALAFLTIALRGPRDRVFAWAGLGAVCLLVALGAETARAWWDYPYSFHLFRQVVTWIALTGFGAALLEAAAARSGYSNPFWLTGIVVGLGIASIGIGDGVDFRIIATLVALSLATAWVTVLSARRAAGPALALLGVLTTSVALAFLNPVQYLDNGVYSLGALSLILFAWRPPSAESASPPDFAPDVDEPRNDPDRILNIRANGNYAEVFMTDGGKTFVRHALSQFPVTGSLMRVHRSHIVNLAYARRMVAATGSRYRLEMTDGSRIPVSRRLVEELRKRMAFPPAMRWRALQDSNLQPPA